MVTLRMSDSELSVNLSRTGRWLLLVFALCAVRGRGTENIYDTLPCQHGYAIVVKIIYSTGHSVWRGSQVLCSV